MGDDELLSRLGNDVRLAEISAKDEMMRSLTRRIGWIWAGFALCWVALALWLLSAVRSRRRYICLAQSRLTNIAPLRKSPRFGLVAASSTEEFPSYSLRKRHALFR